MIISWAKFQAVKAHITLLFPNISSGYILMIYSQYLLSHGKCRKQRYMFSDASPSHWRKQLRHRDMRNTDETQRKISDDTGYCCFTSFSWSPAIELPLFANLRQFPTSDHTYWWGFDRSVRLFLQFGIEFSSFRPFIIYLPCWSAEDNRFKVSLWWFKFFITWEHWSRNK